MAQSYGNTWWGNSWLKSLTHIDYANRIPRGATYARKGSVKDIQVNGNVISAIVAGSQPKPYKVLIKVPSFTKEQTDRLMDRIVERPALISKLLNRELDPEILNIAKNCGLQVFPTQWNDLQMDCNCPDWAVPCKHLAAVIYMMSREIDNNPFLIFEIHNVDLLGELKRRGIAIEKERDMKVVGLAESFLPQKLKDVAMSVPPFRRIDFSRIQHIAEPLMSLLPASPAFYNQGDFQQKYALQLTRVIKGAQKILSKKMTVAEIFPQSSSSYPVVLSKHDNLHIELHDSGIATIAYVISSSEEKSRHPVLSSFSQLPKALSELPVDFLEDYQPSVAALHQAFSCALHLLANGAVIPKIMQLADGKYGVRWFPASIDRQVQGVLDELEPIFPGRAVTAATSSPKKRIYLTNQATNVISLFLNELMQHLSGNVYDDSFLKLFFKGDTKNFVSVGEQEIPGGIKSWLDRYFMATRKYRPVFMVRDDESGLFYLDIGIENTTQPDEEMVMLKEVLTQKRFAKECFGILRDLLMLSSTIPGLTDYVNKNAEQPIRFDGKSFVPFLMNAVPAIRLLAAKVLLPKSLQELLRPKTSLRLSKKSTNEGSFIRMDDLLTFDWQVAIGDEVLSPEDFRKLMGQASGLIRFKQNYIYVDEAELEKIHKALTQPVKLSNARLLQAALTGEYDSAPILLSDEVRSLIKELTTQEDIPLPEGINASLRPYQERGYAWMYRNMRIGFGSIMADDMGLGKTLQVITLLQKIKEEGGLEKKKVLIVAPTSLLTNWQAEVERFAPTLSVSVYHGTGRDLALFETDILLTSYGVLRSDSAVLKKHKWQVMVIDEAQNIKNQDTAQSKAVRSIPAGVHIAMSGTPVENRLSEFWSIMEFTNKGYLDTNKKFKEEYARPIQVFNDRRCAERFRNVTAPFMMRRLKSDKTIISDLPDKIEQNEFALLTKRQAALYEETLQAAMKEIEGIEETDSTALFKRQGLVLQMILALKQICNHPAQFLKNGEYLPELSGKSEMLLDLVSAIVDSGEKVLIFTQFREMGEILQRFIEERTGERPMFYHGSCSVKQRQEMVDRFQTNRADKVFLLSLKAAGTGLNLTAASHVIHYDLWWNPAVEAQATDRAYRIGQHQNVMVHRFITKNTFEERIDEMIQKKKQLADLTVAAGESWIGKMSNKELRDIFG